MGIFIKLTGAQDAADALTRQLLAVRDTWPQARVEPRPPAWANGWRVVVEVDGADSGSIRRVCVDILGD